MHPTRRRLLQAAATGTLGGLAGCGLPMSDDPQDETATATAVDGTPDADEAPTDSDEPTPGSIDAVALETLVDGLEAPLDVAFAPDVERRYVAEQFGVVHVHEADGLRDEPFLDLREAVTAGGEKGLLGLALHPEFAENRRVFVRYSAPSRSGTPDDYSHTFVLAAFEASEDGRRVPLDTERTVLEIPQPQANHNAGAIEFGPDGYLYVAVGDGGAGGDQGRGHVEDWYDAVDGGNGQDVTENLLGSILRIDVDSPDDGGTDDGGTDDGDDGDGGGAGNESRAYAVPEDNPLVGRAGLDEHYAWGLRNPYRMSVDRGRLFVADVGQNRYEEVNVVESGGNYGWNVTEATHCYGAEACPDATPDDVRGGELLREPIVEYPHGGRPVSGISIIGGHVYRGAAVPALEGRYVFGDLQPEGRLFVATETDEGDQWSTDVLDVAGGDADALDRILSFGRDPDGEMYVLGTGAGGGGVHRIVPVD